VNAPFFFSFSFLAGKDAGIISFYHPNTFKVERFSTSIFTVYLQLHSFLHTLAATVLI